MTWETPMYHEEYRTAFRRLSVALAPQDSTPSLQADITSWPSTSPHHSTSYSTKSSVSHASSSFVVPANRALCFFLKPFQPKVCNQILFSTSTTLARFHRHGCFGTAPATLDKHAEPSISIITHHEQSFFNVVDHHQALQAIPFHFEPLLTILIQYSFLTIIQYSEPFISILNHHSSLTILFHSQPSSSLLNHIHYESSLTMVIQLSSVIIEHSELSIPIMTNQKPPSLIHLIL